MESELPADGVDAGATVAVDAGATAVVDASVDAATCSAPPQKCRIDRVGIVFGPGALPPACAGQGFELDWQADGETCELSCDGGSSWSAVACDDSQLASLSRTGVCQLRAANACGSTMCSESVEVTSTPTCNVYYSPSSIPRGSSSTVFWSSSRAESCEYEWSPEPGVWRSVACSGSLSFPTINANTTIKLKARNGCGEFTCTGSVSTF